MLTEARAGDVITLDLETYDPNIYNGSCSNPAGGYVFLAGVAVNDGPVHTLPWDAPTKQWLVDALKCGCRWVGANLKYDLRWLLWEGVLTPPLTKTNQFSDVLLYAALLDETQLPAFYSLNGQAKHHKLPEKPIEMLLEAARGQGLKATEKSVRGQLHLLPVDVVKDYLHYDITTTREVYHKQLPLLVEEKLEKVKELEDKLLPVLALMEHRGTRVDVLEAEKLHDAVYKHIDERKERLKQANGGVEVCLNASNNLRNFLTDRGHRLPSTDKGTLSTKEEILKELATVDPLVGDIIVARKAEKIAKDFCKGAIIESSVGGRIHPNINQLIGFKGDSSGSQGTRSGRLSYGSPNLQQVPKRDKVGFDDTGGLGTAMRKIFIAEDGCQYMSADFSAQEPRWIVHWAEVWGIPGAAKVGEQYRQDPTISSHDIVAARIHADNLDAKSKRNVAKIINLGKGYEMGPTKLAEELVKAGIDPTQAPKLIQMYEEEFPHVSGASRSAMAFADKTGYVRTWSGRKARFTMWEPADRSGTPLNEAAAKAKYLYGQRKPIKRSGTYRGFNRIVQGSSADQTKTAMVVLWYDYNILPTLQVHDELDDAGIADTKTIKIYREVMEHCIELTVPSLTEITLGRNWAEGTIIEA